MSIDGGPLRAFFTVLSLSIQPAGTAGAQVVHAQQRAVAATAAPTEVVTIATGGVRAVTPVTASAVVSTTLSPVQSQTRPLVPQVTPGVKIDLCSSFCNHSMIFIFLLNLPICRCPSSARYSDGNKVPYSSPTADVTTAAAPGSSFSDQRCRQTSGMLASLCYGLF